MQVVAKSVGVVGAEIGLDPSDRQVHLRELPRRRVRLLPEDRDVANPTAVLADELFALKRTSRSSRSMGRIRDPCRARSSRRAAEQRIGAQCRGRLGTPAAVVLRMLVLKHLHDWSFDECEREVRGSLVYRAFCRIDGERVPDAKTLIRLARLLDEPVLKDVLARLVALGRERRVVRGRRLRVDTTVVETNIHYPTDATLLADGVRVLTRTLRRIGGRVRERTRSVARRVFEIAQRSRTAGRQTRRSPRAAARGAQGCRPGRLASSRSLMLPQICSTGFNSGA